MFSVVMVHAGPERGRFLRALALDTGELEILRDLDRFPSDAELHYLLNTLQPEVFLLDLAAGQRALECALVIHGRFPAIAIIGIGSSAVQAKSAPAGFSVALPDPVREADLRSAVARAIHATNGGVETNLFSFLPSKAGSGASTIVLNTATTLAGQFGKRVLVMDVDIRSGIQAVMLNLAPSGSIHNLLGEPKEIDEFRWRNAAMASHGVDFLLSPPSPDAQPRLWQDYFRLVNFARARYDAILVDLPELVNPATVELVRRSHMVFPVCTSELPSLNLARQRCDELRACGLPAERTGLLLNRWQSSDPTPAEVAAMLQTAVIKRFPSDYLRVKSAVKAGAPVPADCPLGKAFAEFAALLLGSHYDEPAPHPKQNLVGKLRGLWGAPGETPPAGPDRPR